MTSAARTTDRRRAGFTLIELVLVLAIAVIIMGGALGMMIYSSDERSLRETSAEIEMMAKRARTTAILQQTPYALEFREGIVRLMPLAEAGRDEEKTVGGHAIGGDEVESKPGERRDFSLPAGMELAVRRWNSDAWLPAAKKAVHVWRFDPNGLCEPLSVRMALEKSWCEDIYHPLTATVKESQLEAR